MIGAGIFTTSGLLLSDLNDPVLMIALWLVGGFIALCGALCYGELGAAMPNAGGEYVFISRIFHPLPGFLSGWVSFIVGFSAPIAASSIGFSEYLYRAVPGAFHFDAVSVSLVKKFFSILVIVAFTLVHLRGMDFGSRVQNFLTLLKVLLVVGLVVVGFAFGRGSFDHFSEMEVITAAPANWKTIGLSLMWIMFAYSGYNASVYIGSEIKNPSVNLPRSLIVGTGAVVLLYLGLNTLFVYAVPVGALKGVISVGGVAVDRLFGPASDTFFSLAIALALFSSISAFIILGPRVYYAMAKDGYFFRFASKVHPKHHVPSWSIIFQGGISIIIVLSGTFDQILTYMGFALGIFPLLTILGLFRLRMQNKVPIRLPGFPYTAIVFIIAGVSILVLAFMERPTESLIAIATVLLGIPAYYLFLKRRRT